ncbi:MAG: haloacid dehalogenase [Armatimonadota bacterium]
MSTIETICKRLCAEFELRNQARERALALSRNVVRTSANAIRHVHRGEIDGARELLAQAAEAVRQMREAASPYGDILYAGYVHDAQKEFAEAACVLALILEEPLPEPEELLVEPAAYLNGLGEAIGELRRHILDKIRLGEVPDAERKLQIADDVYYNLIVFDYPEALTGGLRRTTDAMRALLERTRGEVTLALRQLRLEQALEAARHGETHTHGT